MKEIKEYMNMRFANIEMIKSFDSYIAVLEYHLNKAYDIIFKDKILIYSIEAMKLDDKQFQEVSKRFIKLALKMLGPNLKKEFEYLYGNEETLLFNIVEFFHTKYEDDEIRRTSQNQLMQGGEEEKVEESEELTF